MQLNLLELPFSEYKLTVFQNNLQPFAYARSYSAMAREYDPMSDSLGMDNSRSYLGGRSLSGPDGMASLRDTAINSNSIEAEDRNRYLASRRFVGYIMGFESTVSCRHFLFLKLHSPAGQISQREHS